MVKNPPDDAGDVRDRSSIPGLGRSSRRGNVSPLHYSCLENPMDRSAWRALDHRVTKSQTQLKPLSRQNYLNISMTSTSCWNPDYLILEVIAISWLDYRSISSPVSGRANITCSSEYTISLLNISHDLLSST